MRSANRKWAQHLHGWRQAANSNPFQASSASPGDSITSISEKDEDEAQQLFHDLLSGCKFGDETPVLDMSHERDQRGSNSCFPFSPRTKKRFDLFQAIISHLRKVKGNSEEQRKGILILYCLSEKGLAGEVIAAGGLKIITEAMKHHPRDVNVQCNGVKALACFADKGWARDVAGVPQGVVSAIDSNTPIFLVNQAMQEHPSEAELQRLGIRTFRALADADERLHEIVVAAGGINLTHNAGKNHPSELKKEVEWAVGSFARSGLGKEVMPLTEMLQRWDSTESNNKDISNPTMRNDIVKIISPPMSETKRTGQGDKEEGEVDKETKRKAVVRLRKRKAVVRIRQSCGYGISLDKETKRKERVAMRTLNMDTDKCVPVQDHDLNSVTARQQPFTNTANARQRRKSGQKSAHSEDASTTAVQELSNTEKAREMISKKSEYLVVVPQGLQEEDEQV